jgi:hypothetical protein
MAMTEALSPKEALSPEEMENVRIGYQVAVNLWWYLGDLVWAKYNAMLVVNGIVAAAIGIGLTSQQPAPILTIGLSVVGLVLCVLWFQLVELGFGLFVPYIAAARELEEKYLDRVKVVSRGTEVVQGKSMNYEIEKGGEPITLSVQLTDIARKAETQKTAKLVIAVFAAAYVIMLIQALIQAVW